MKETLLAKKYTQSLLAALDESEAMATFTELSDIIDTIVNSHNVWVLVKSPLYSINDTSQMILNVVKKATDRQQLHNFFQLLVQKKRLTILPEIKSEARQVLSQLQQQSDVTIYVSAELDTDTQESITKYIETKTAQSIAPTFVVDTSMLGGFKAVLDNYILDCSVQNRLERLKESMLSN